MESAIQAQKDAMFSVESIHDSLQRALEEGDRATEEMMFLRRKVGLKGFSSRPPLTLCIVQADSDNGNLRWPAWPINSRTHEIEIK